MGTRKPAIKKPDLTRKPNARKRTKSASTLMQNIGKSKIAKVTLAAVAATIIAYGGAKITQKAVLDAFLRRVPVAEATELRSHATFRESFNYFWNQTYLHGKGYAFTPQQVDAFAKVLDILRDYNGGAERSRRTNINTPAELLDMMRNFPLGSPAWPIINRGNVYSVTGQRINLLESRIRQAEQRGRSNDRLARARIARWKNIVNALRAVDEAVRRGEITAEDADFLVQMQIALDGLGDYNSNERKDRTYGNYRSPGEGLDPIFPH